MAASEELRDVVESVQDESLGLETKISRLNDRRKVGFVHLDFQYSTFIDLTDVGQTAWATIVPALKSIGENYIIKWEEGISMMKKTIEPISESLARYEKISVWADLRRAELRCPSAMAKIVIPCEVKESFSFTAAAHTRMEQRKNDLEASAAMSVLLSSEGLSGRERVVKNH